MTMADEPIDPGHDPGPEVYADVVPIRPVPPGGDERPVVRLTADLHVVVPQVVAALATGPHRAENLYQRDGELVRVVVLAEPEVVRGVEIAAAGTPQMRDVPLPALREMIASACDLKAFHVSEEKWISVSPKPDIAAMISTRAEWPGIRPIVGLSESPILRPDFSIASASGYDRATGVVLIPSCSFPAGPEHPTQADAAAALARLVEPFDDFPFESPAAKMVAIAAILTVIARFAIVGAVPAFIFDASLRGAGKSLLAHVVATIATGRAAALATFPSGKNADEELEKMLSSFAMRGASMIAFDNVSTPICGAPLDKVLTAVDKVDFRLLGQSRIITCAWRAVITASGNQVDVLGDTARRVIVARLVPTDENPETRTDFAHAPLVPWVLANRPRLVADALTILRAFHLAGQPECGVKLLGSFEAWTKIVPRAIVFAGGADVTTCRPATDVPGTDASKDALRATLDAWDRLDPNNEGLLTRDLVARVWPSSTSVAPDGLADLREAWAGLVKPPRGETVPRVVDVGRALRGMRDRHVAGRCLSSEIDDRSRTMRWVVKRAKLQ